MGEYKRPSLELPPDLDAEKLKEAALALLSLTEDVDGRVWKALDWGLMNELFAEGWIEDPLSKYKSVLMTPAGRARAAEFLKKHFAK